MNTPLGRPLKFGDPEQIAAIRKADQDAQEKERIALLPKCRKCDGMGLCGHCQQECPDCNGSGKIEQ